MKSILDYKENTAWLAVKSGVSEAIFKNVKQGIFPKKKMFTSQEQRNREKLKKNYQKFDYI